MTTNSLKKLKALFSDTDMDPEKRQELLGLLSDLERELAPIVEEESEDADSIAGFTKMAAHESLKKEKNPELMDASQKGMMGSIRKFEVTKPELVRIINRMSNVLSGFGV
jgi:hypothetical protein